MGTKVIEILSEMSNVPKESITRSSRLAGDLGLSSLDMLTILVRFEEELNITIDDRQIPDIQTVGDILDMLVTQ